MKDLLCEAFCESLDVRPVPVGFAVSTPYRNADGDQLLLYLVREGSSGRWRIEDDGTQIAWLEANGVDLGGRARGDALQALLSEHGAMFDKEERTVHTAALDLAGLGAAAVQFTGLLLRLQDLALLRPQIVRNAWRDDALATIHRAFDSVAEVEEAIALEPDLIGQEADLIIRRPGSATPPLAIFLATSEERALHAIVAKMEAEKYRRIDSRFALIVERLKRNPVRESTYGLAHARLDAVLSFHESQRETLERLSTMAGIELALAD